MDTLPIPVAPRVNYVHSILEAVPWTANGPVLRTNEKHRLAASNTRRLRVPIYPRLT